jgi:hypothetical protein
MVYKLHRPEGAGWRVSVYDLATDPTESRDLFDAGDSRHAARAADLRAYKAHLVERYEAGRLRERERLLGADAEAEALRALGYIQ